MFDNKNTHHYRNILTSGWKKIVGLSLLALFISVIAAGITHTPTHAASLELKTTQDEKIQKLLMNRFLGYCIKNAPLSGGVLIDNGARITGNATANKGDWFLSDAETMGPYMTDNRFGLWSGADDGGYIRPVGFGDCGDEKTIALALKTIGKSGVEVLCKSGFVRSDGSDGGTYEGCVAGNGDFKHKNGSKTGSDESYKAFVKAYPEPSLSDKEWYWFYRKTFNWSCGYGKMSTPVGKATADGNKDFGYSLTYVTDTAPYKETKYFIGLEKRDVTISTRLNADGTGTSVDRTCAQIQTHINEYGDKYAASLAAEAANGTLDEELAGETAGSKDEEGGGTTANASSCAIDGIGWIVCPVINFLAGIADASFDFISETFLRTDVKLLDTSGPTYEAWTVMRNVANVAFVIVFMIIIFSQLTGVGVSNYGVKKMLPRLVIAAILVNISFILCQLAVDLSNILGYSIDGAIAGVGDSMPISGGQVEFLAGGSTFTDVTVTVLAMGGAVVALYAMLSVLLPVILAAVIALVMIMFLLVARQALIVILIVLAPLAFVAFLLPNTERFFTQWRKMFTALLLLFPIIAVVFGLSKLASVILTGSFSSDFSDDDTANSMWGQIVGAAVLILPLFIVPILLKKSLDGVPMLGQLASKWANRATGNVSSKARESYAGSLVGRGRAIRKNAREAYRGRKFAERITESKASGINKMFASGIPTPGAGVAANEALTKSATAAMVKAKAEEVSDARSLIEERNLSGKQRQDIAMGRVPVDTKTGKAIKGFEGETMQKAALQMQLGGAGSWGEVQEIISASSSSLSKYAANIGAQAGASAGKDPAFSGKRIDQISQGKFNYDEAVADAIGEGKYTSEAFATMNDGAREQAIKVARAKEAAGDPSLINALKQAATGIRASSEISGKISGNQEAQKQIAALIGAAPAVTAQQSAAVASATVQQAPTGPAQVQPGGGLQIAHGAQQVHAAAAQAANQPPQTPPTQPPTTP